MKRSSDAAGVKELLKAAATDGNPVYGNDDLGRI
jgi:hypothetical protein